VEDRYRNKGPLAGLETALFHRDADVYMIAACDMPFIDQQVYTFLLDQLEQYDAVIPIHENRLHPLTGIYRRSAMPAIQQQLDKNDLKVRSIFDHIRVNYVRDYGTIPNDILTRHFFNMNDQVQYEQAKKYRLS
jgi:molybdopterin-guanine dinucleotide biosynthesis protein A